MKLTVKVLLAHEPESKRKGCIRGIGEIGSEDDIVPLLVAQSFLNRMGDPFMAKLVEIPRFDHKCCWVTAWHGLLAPYRPLSIFVDKGRQKKIK